MRFPWPIAVLVQLAVSVFGVGPLGASQDPAAWVNMLTDTLPTAVGGLAVDRTGALYSADFSETVYKITPDGTVSILATGLYGASGNAVDSRGNVLQSNFFAHTVSKIGRDGRVTTFASEGLNGPVGIAIDPDDNLYVANCRGNSVSRIAHDGTVTAFASSEHFRCPNGIAFGDSSILYTVNIGDGVMTSITPDGQVQEFATIPSGGGHIAFARGRLYVTSFNGSRVYRVTLGGDVAPVAGSGVRGLSEGEALEARLSSPNGIAADQLGERVYVNNYIGPFAPAADDPPRSVIAVIKLVSVTDRFMAALAEGGLEPAVAAYRRYKLDPTNADVNTERVMNRLGYRLLGAKNYAPAIEVFKLNVESYPDSWNVYDSLAEAYRDAGERERAIELYEKSLELNATNGNAKANLEELRSRSPN